MSDEQKTSCSSCAGGGSDSENAQPACSCSCSSSPWRWFAIIAVVAIIVVLFSNRATQNDYSNMPGIVWNNDYNATMTLAGQQGKPVLLAFHAKWCGYCTKMKETTYHAPEVVKVVENFIPIMIDTDQQGDIAQKYDVGPIPAYVITKPDGTVIEKFLGYYDPGDFVARLNSSLQRYSSQK
jgi:thiol:disulfide interchange protein